MYQPPSPPATPGQPPAFPPQPFAPPQQPIPWAPILGIMAVVAVALGVLFLVSNQAATYEATIHQKDGSDQIGGLATNHSGQGCSHFTVHVKFYDHNDALVGEQQDPDIGEVAAEASRPWSYQLTSLGFVPYDVPDNVTSATISASCEDQR